MGFFRKYEGNITPEKDVIFVFGSNPEGRHGAGSAKVAVNQFGAIYGQGEGLQGNAYALPTTELRYEFQDHTRYNRQSLPENQIVESIIKLYDCCKATPDKKFKVAYRSQPDEVTLCGYAGKELMAMFVTAKYQWGDWPSNIYFSKEWWDSGFLSGGMRHEIKANVGESHEGCWVLVGDEAYNDCKNDGCVNIQHQAILLNDMVDGPYSYGDEITIITQGPHNPTTHPLIIDGSSVAKQNNQVDLKPVLVFYISTYSVDFEEEAAFVNSIAENFVKLFNSSGYYLVFIPDRTIKTSRIECLNPRHLMDDGQKTTVETLQEFTKKLTEYLEKSQK